VWLAWASGIQDNYYLVFNPVEVVSMAIPLEKELEHAFAGDSTAFISRPLSTGKPVTEPWAPGLRAGWGKARLKTWWCNSHGRFLS
jgi:hypothetical protein